MTTTSDNRDVTAPGEGVPRLGFLLLISLLLILVLMPFMQAGSTGVLIEKILWTLMLCAAVASAGGRTGVGVALIVLTPVLVFDWVYQLHPVAWTRLAACGGSIVFLGWLTWRLIGAVLRSRRVGSDVICAALSAYLLIGVMWAMGYVAIAQLVPGSFKLPEGTDVNRLVPFELMYFSFITLCTVGYGDIVPLSNPARMLAMMEAIIGMIYTTVLLARLVSLYSSAPRDQNS